MMPITNSRAAGFACCLVFGLLTASATAFAADVLRFDIDATPTPPPSVMERPSLAPDIAQLEHAFRASILGLCFGRATSSG